MLTSERSAWRQAVKHGLSEFEETLVQQAEARRQSRNQQNQGAGQQTDCVCVGGIVTLELAFSATLDGVPRTPYTARYHSLSRLKDAKQKQ